MANNSRLTHLLVLDFEATCGESGGAFPKAEQTEVIEFPTILYNLQNKQIEATFHEYVRPVRHPILTDYCTKLTGIAQNTVDAADTFPRVWKRYQAFLKTNGVLDNPESFSLITCGNWDIKTMLPDQLAYTASIDATVSPTLPPPLDRWINVKSEFKRLYKKPKGMVSMLDALDIKLEGRHHSGIDDCKNILRILQRMQQDGWVPVISA